MGSRSPRGSRSRTWRKRSRRARPARTGWPCRAPRPAGHRGGFVDDGSDEGGIGLLALLRVVARATPLPMVAAGGIADGAALAAVLCAGASAAAIGTALMLAPEAGNRRTRSASCSPSAGRRA